MDGIYQIRDKPNRSTDKKLENEFTEICSMSLLVVVNEKKRLQSIRWVYWVYTWDWMLDTEVLYALVWNLSINSFSKEQKCLWNLFGAEKLIVLIESSESGKIHIVQIQIIWQLIYSMT